MPIAEDGFLAESLDDVRALVRQKYPEWRALLGRVNLLDVDVWCMTTLNGRGYLRWVEKRGVGEFRN
ncbi:MAG: hypothetical protein H0W28_03610 [Pyrinomonadaceae bacterium]|nr:hypothetical protein [Pyrinomonadaceae bacterium]